MTNLNANFEHGKIINVSMQVPLVASQALRRLAEITHAKAICVAGGFVRGLYMQQALGLSPQMNDIDVFADLPHEDFDSIEEVLRWEFGTPIRFHIGRFEKEKNPRGLLEFAVPKSLREKCAGVESIQLNFGKSHPWANAFEYISLANAGMNQIAIDPDGRVIASQLFMDDMTNKTMTMNPEHHWTPYDWDRTSKSLERMKKERPEFHGWKIIKTTKPSVPESGVFWESQKVSLDPSPTM